MTADIAGAIRHVSGCGRCASVVRQIEIDRAAQLDHDTLIAQLKAAADLHTALMFAAALEAHDNQLHMRVQTPPGALTS